MRFWSYVFLVAFIVGMFLAVHRTDHSPVIVENDDGGLVSDYNNRFDYFTNHHIKVFIKGTCASACARYMKLPDVCAMPNSYFLFHGLTDRETDEVLVDEGIEDSEQTDTPQAFDLERKYDTFHMGYSDTRPYRSLEVEQGVWIVYHSVQEQGQERFQEFLKVRAEKLIKACP